MMVNTTIPAIAFVGKKNSGKTTLLVAVVAELASRGLRVGTVKHHSHAGFEFDVEGKDSWRHRQAGSVYTVIAAPDQIASLRSVASELPLEQIIAEMSAAARVAVAKDAGGASTGAVEHAEGAKGASTGATERAEDGFASATERAESAQDGWGDPSLRFDLDIILVEGYRHGGLPTIELFRAANPNDAERQLGGEGNQIIAIITDIPRIVATAETLQPPCPVFTFADITGIADFVIAWARQRRRTEGRQTAQGHRDGSSGPTFEKGERLP